MDRARGVRVLHQDAEAVLAHRVGPVVSDHDRDAEGLGTGLHDVNRLGMTGGGDKEDPVLACGALLQAVAHHHGLGGGRALVQHGAISDLEAGQVADHGLEVQDRFEPALGNLGLVGGVGGVPGGVLQDCPLDHAGG